jgi:hypothetical protein
MLKELTSTQINALTPDCLELLLKKSITQDDIDRLKKLCEFEMPGHYEECKSKCVEFENLIRNFDDEIFYVEYTVTGNTGYSSSVKTVFDCLMTQEEFDNKYENIDPNLISYSGSIYNEEPSPNYSLKLKDNDELWTHYHRHQFYYKGIKMNPHEKTATVDYTHENKINLYGLSYRNKNLRIIHPGMKKTVLLLNRLNLLNREKKKH